MRPTGGRASFPGGSGVCSAGAASAIPPRRGSSTVGHRAADLYLHGRVGGGGGRRRPLSGGGRQTGVLEPDPGPDLEAVAGRPARSDDEAKAIASMRSAVSVTWLIAVLALPGGAGAHSVPSEEQRAVVDATLAEIAAGKTKTLWALRSSKQGDVIPRPTSRADAERVATPEEIAAFLAFSQTPENAKISDWSGLLLYPCAHLLLPGSTMAATDFGVSGNDNGTLIGGADISVTYPAPEKSPVVFLNQAMTEPHRLKSVEISVMYTADVGSPDILDPTEQHFVMDKENCQIMGSTDW